MGDGDGVSGRYVGVPSPEMSSSPVGMGLQRGTAPPQKKVQF